MKQRVCIAMAIVLNPALIIADEPTSALDVVVQRVVAQTLLDVKRRLNVSMILIGHDRFAGAAGRPYRGHVRRQRGRHVRKVIQNDPAAGRMSSALFGQARCSTCHVPPLISYLLSL
jgi:ABC-type ATPase involved in cell division